jgi:hypothetical protein
VRFKLDESLSRRATDLIRAAGHDAVTVVSQGLRGAADETLFKVCYSSYLTPKLGLTSADTWAAITLVVRNLILNWLIMVPVICLVLLSVKFLAALIRTSDSAAANATKNVILAVLLIGAGWSLAYKIYRLYLQPKQQASSAKNEQAWFLVMSVLSATIAGICFAWLLENRIYSLHPFSTFCLWLEIAAIAVIVLVVVFSLVMVLLTLRVVNRPPALDGQIVFWPGLLFVPELVATVATRDRLWDLVGWSFGAITAGTMIWLGFFLSGHFLVDYLACGGSFRADLIPTVFGMPWFLLSMLVGQLGYVLIRSYSKQGDYEREWLARAGGWFIISALAWIILSGLVLLGSDVTNGLNQGVEGFLKWLAGSKDWLAGLATVFGLVTAALGTSSSTPARGKATSKAGIAANIGLAVAGPLFAMLLVLLFSSGLDNIVLAVKNRLQISYVLAIVTLGGGVALTMIFANFFVNVNRFSLHATYRNRLIRAFLGGPHAFYKTVEPLRQVDGFTGFDPEDNLRMRALWDGPVEDGDWRPFHVVNMTLNLAATKNLAWQQRKAESFTVTPRYCGCASANLGYRKTEEYGNPGGSGISLGTAMAISGAAVSPNMGYHSSPSVAFLLTLLNVRLGWWLGNPGPAGGQDGPIGRIIKPIYKKTISKIIYGEEREAAPYRQDAPWFSLRPLLTELFGLTSDTSRYVYLSDGGHFENLGIYEMVRRRCRWIVVSDAGADPDRGFEDLGNAVRKIWIDFGVRITFEKCDLLLVNEETKPIVIPYCALGTIEYLNDGDGRATGKILYIKPVVRGDEPVADIIAYLRAHEKFPHQSTAEQWFDEPQLESYRVLGYWMMKRILDSAQRVGHVGTLEDLFASLEKLDFKTMNRSSSLGFVTG